MASNTTITVTPHLSMPWFVRLHFKFNPAIVRDLKVLPGCTWDSVEKCWLVPIDLYELMKRGVIKLGEEGNKSYGKDSENHYGV